MSNFIIIFACFIFGLGCKSIKRFPTLTGLSLNLFIIYVSLPALILTKFPPLVKTLTLGGLWWVPISMAWLSFLFSWIIISYIGRKLAWPRTMTGALILTAGLGNTSFVGFPLLEAILGKSAISIGILADQPGSFLIVSSLGILVAAQFSGESLKAKVIFQKVFSFPPFLALLLAVLWSLGGLPAAKFLNEPLEKISQTLVPMALFAVGFQTNFRWSAIKERRNALMLGLGLKLIVFPLGFYLFYRHILGLNDFFVQVTILEAAMATQITSAVVANEFNLDGELANLMVSLSIPLSLASVPLLNHLLFS